MLLINKTGSPTSPAAPEPLLAKPGVTPRVLLTEHITLGSYGKSLNGELFVELCFKVGGETISYMVPLADLTATSRVFTALNNAGAHVLSPQARRELIDRLQAHQPQGPMLDVATRLGWHGSNFVLPGLTFGPDKKTLRVYLDESRPDRTDRFRVGGSLKGWQEIAKLAVGNSRLQLLIATALHGPVAALLQREQANFMLVGPGGIGKTTANVAAASVCGCHVDPVRARKFGFCQSFNATVNDLEDELMAVNDMLLSVDETREADLTDDKIGPMLIRLVMRLDSGSEKGRQTASGARQSAVAPFITTSNLSLVQFGRLARLPIDDAIHGRLITVPAPTNAHGMFEDLHGDKDVPAFAKRLHTLALANFGHPSRELLDALVRENAEDPEKLRRWLERMRSVYLFEARKIVAPSRDLKRIHERMATVYATGGFAISRGILQLDINAFRGSLLACARDHVACVAEDEKHLHLVPANVHPIRDKSFKREDILAQFQKFVHENIEGIIDITAGEAVNRLSDNASEWPILRSKHRVYGVEYLFSDRKLLSIFGDKSKVQALKAALNERGWIATEMGEGGLPRYSVKRSIMGKGRVQVIAIRAAAFEEKP
jgi:hypothetical protein